MTCFDVFSETQQNPTITLTILLTSKTHKFPIHLKSTNIFAASQNHQYQRYGEINTSAMTASSPAPFLYQQRHISVMWGLVHYRKRRLGNTIISPATLSTCPSPVCGICGMYRQPPPVREHHVDRFARDVRHGVYRETLSHVPR